MVNVNFNLRNPKAKEETPINVVIRYANLRLVYPSRERINPAFWETDKDKRNFQRARETKKFSEYPEFNARLNGIAQTIRDLFRRFQNDNNNSIPEPETLKKLLDKEFKRKVELPKTLFSFLEEFIRQSESRTNEKTGKPISKNTIKTYRTLLKHLLAFQSLYKRKVDFKTIDLEFYSDYREFLTSNLILSTNSIGKDIQILKVLLHEASERGLNTNQAFKSKKFKVIREKSDSIYLTEDEISEIERLDLSGNTKLDRVRDLFLVGCYTGLRYSDFSKLSKEHITPDGRIRIETQKTGEPVVIPIHPVVKNIIAKYRGDLPPSISNQKTNEYLKELGAKLTAFSIKVSKSITKGGIKTVQTFDKWQLLTSHTARRSFATNLYLQGFPSISIMKITGHQTERAFLRYIKVTPKESAILLEQHWQRKTQLKAV